MRHSILLTIVILAIGAAAAWQHKQRLATLRTEARELERQARQSGLDPAADRLPASAPQARHQREDRATRIKRLVDEISSLALDVQEIDDGGEELDPLTMRRTMDLIAALGQLDSAAFLQLIGRLREGGDGQAGSGRARFIGFALLTLADDHPQLVLAVHAECADWLGKSPPGDQILCAALGAWARQDPFAALDWLDRNGGKFPQAGTDEVIDAILDGAARRDPGLAFSMLERLDARDPAESLTAIIASAADGPEQRSAVLAALRAHLATVQDPRQQEELRGKALELMARGIDSEDFAATSDWLAAQQLSTQEIADFAAGLTYFTTGRDSGKWVEWLAGRLPAGQLADPVREIVGEWTQQDYLAAGNWLATAPAGPAKAAAVEAYAAAVAEYEPQVAEQWALTLPPGTQREATLRAIHDNWPATDPAGAEAFARKHQIEP